MTKRPAEELAIPSFALNRLAGLPGGRRRDFAGATGEG